MTNETDTIQRQAQAWVVRLDSQQATADDARAFKRWVAQSTAHARAFVSAREVWQAMAPAARRVRQDAGNSARSEAATGVRNGRRAFLGGALAASLAYIAVRPPLQLWPSATEWRADYRTGTGEQREVATGDGVLVRMNTQTRINAEGGANAPGLELLSGEAEIQADAGRPAVFTVRAGGGIVSAVAARFNVRYTGADVCVTCLAGRVQVGQEVHRADLRAGEQLTYGAAHFGQPGPADAMAVSAWRRRLLVFNQAPLSRVVEEVNRYRPGKLILRSDRLGRDKVQASFSIDRLDDVIALIHDAYGAEVTRLPGGIVLLDA